MSCQPPNSIGSDGKCYAPCPMGYVNFGNSNLQCIQSCPPGFTEAEGGCIRPKIPRDKKPFLQCPPGAQRIVEQCLLQCPNGTAPEFELCNPVCPRGFTENADGTVCEAEFMQRTAVPRPACQENETRVDNQCLSPCQSGMAENPLDATQCVSVMPKDLQKYFTQDGFIYAKIKFGRTRTDATALRGYSTAGNATQSDCPLNTDALVDSCLVQCPAGFVQQVSSCGRQVINRNSVSSSPNIVGTLIKVIFVIFIIIFVLRFLFSFLKGQSAQSSE